MGSMPAKPVRFKENDGRRAVRIAVKEGLTVSGFEILPDGTIRVIAAPGKQDSELDKWLGEHPDAGQAQGHQ